LVHGEIILLFIRDLSLINVDQLLAKENNIAPIPNFVPTESFRAQGILKHRSNNNYYCPTGMESKRKKGGGGGEQG
jgi:hypothetical protein